MKIGILGTGAYGLALADALIYNKNKVAMWTNSKEEMEELSSKRFSNKINYNIPKEVTISTDMESVCSDKDIIVMCVPTRFVLSVSSELSKYYKKKQTICIASKGIDGDRGQLLYDIVYESLKSNNIAVISGGTFAVDVIKRVPVGLSLATKNSSARDKIILALQSDYLKIRWTRDIVGTEICGSIKNVMAIATGILEGMGLPESTKCMFITESLHDIKALIKALGGDDKTILSYAGFGDLLLTCTSYKSRNYTFGKMIGEKKSKKEIDDYVSNTTIEGLYTLKSVRKLLKRKKVALPIIDIMHSIIEGNKDPDLLVKFLMEKE